MRRNLSNCAVALILGTLFTGCAWYRITPIPASEAEWSDKSNHPNKLRDGYIIYQPELYFMVTISASGTNAPTGAGAPKTEPAATVTAIYLPNKAKPYRVTTHNFLGKADFEFQFENGWKLTSLSDKSDNSTVANTLAGQLQAAISSAVKPLVAEKPTPQVLLFKPVYDTDGTINGFTPVSVNYSAPGTP